MSSIFFLPKKSSSPAAPNLPDAKSLRKSPLAEKIFDLGGIVSVFITPDMISVTKEEKALWNDLKPQIMAEIMDHFSLGEEAVIPSDAAPDEAEIIRQIQGLINARIRPALQQDGGDITFIKFDRGIVYVELKGQLQPAALMPPSR